MNRILLTVLGWTGLATGAAAAQSFSFLYDAGAYSTVSVPGSTSTTVVGINDVGQMAGDYAAPDVAAGFVDAGGLFTTVAPPHAFSTSVAAINDSGTVVGTSEGAGAFGFAKTGSTYATIAPAGAFSSSATAINASGNIVGTESGGFGKGSAGAFEDIGGTYSQLSRLNAYNISPIGISSSDVVVGSFETNTFEIQNFVYSAGSGFTSIFDPGAGETIINAISPSGIIAGYDVTTGPSGDIDSGYTYSNGIFTTIDVPGALQTQIVAVNDSGDVTGYYYTSNAKFAFVYEGGQFTTLDAPGSSETDPVAINAAGEVVGTALPTPPLPEPAAWLIMLAGFGLVGATLRSGRARPAKA